MDLQNKAVLVTGGSRGIGLAIAKALAREGCRVAIAGRDAEKLRRAAESYQGQPSLLWRPCDVADRQAVGELFAWVEKTLGPLDILVNSAGINIRRRAGRMGSWFVRSYQKPWGNQYPTRALKQCFPGVAT